MFGVAAAPPHLPPSLGSTVVIATPAELGGTIDAVLGISPGLLQQNKVFTSEGRRPGFSGLPLL